MQIPDCYDPAVQEAYNALAHTARVLRLPRCQCCDNPINTERYLELEPFGVSGLACGACVQANLKWTDEMEV